jgi:hypothetical protein
MVQGANGWPMTTSQNPVSNEVSSNPFSSRNYACSTSVSSNPFSPADKDVVADWPNSDMTLSASNLSSKCFDISQDSGEHSRSQKNTMEEDKLCEDHDNESYVASQAACDCPSLPSGTELDTVSRRLMEAKRKIETVEHDFERLLKELATQDELNETDNDPENAPTHFFIGSSPSSLGPSSRGCSWSPAPKKKLSDMASHA